MDFKYRGFFLLLKSKAMQPENYLNQNTHVFKGIQRSNPQKNDWGLGLEFGDFGINFSPDLEWIEVSKLVIYNTY